MTIKITNNAQVNFSLKIRKQTSDDINEAIKELAEITGVKIVKGDIVDQMLNYALDTAPIEIPGGEKYTFRQLLELRESKNQNED